MSRPLKFDQLLWLAQGGRCFFCNEPMLERKPVGTDPNHPNAATKEHLFPQSRYPTKTNIWVWAHNKCNVAKGDRDPTLSEYCRYQNIETDRRKVQRDLDKRRSAVEYMNKESRT